MRLTAQLLTEDEQHRIHNMSVRILEEVGIRFHGERAPKILRENGIKINREDKIARIPSDIVDRTLKTAPKSFVLGARNPVYNFPLPAPFTRYGIDGTAAPAYKARDVAANSRPQRFLAGPQPPHKFEDR